MTTLKVPYLMRYDETGLVTGVLLEDRKQGIFVANGDKDCLRALTEYVRWQADGSFYSDFLNGKLELFKVRVRPEVRENNKVFPGRPLTVEVACVSGHHENGQQLAVLPLLDLSFYFVNPKELGALVQELARDVLRSWDPGALIRLMRPCTYQLGHIPVRLKEADQSVRPTDLPILNRLAENLGERKVRKRFANAWERDGIINDLQLMLNSSEHLAIVGPEGIGKTTVLVHAIHSWQREQDKTDPYRNYRFWSIQPGNLIAGMKYLGEWQKQVEELIRELERCEGVLIVDRLGEFIRLGGCGPEDSLAAFFLPFLQRGDLRMFVEASQKEWETCATLLPALTNLFNAKHLHPFDESQRRQMLVQLEDYLRDRYHLDVDAGCGDMVAGLFKRFRPYQPFPAEVLRFLDQLGQTHKGTQTKITQELILDNLIKETGLPELIVKDTQPMCFDEVVDHLRQRVMGQEVPTEAAAEVVTRFKAGMNDPGRPLAVLMFCGPTGVGKTELAKALADYLFGHGEDRDQRLVRLDMSEFNSYGAAERLLGDPNGDVPAWLKQVRRNPFCVVLFDEIEKAATDVFDIMLTLLDEGRLTDVFGREIDFRSSIIIMTSNLGAGEQPISGLGAPRSANYVKAVGNYFRPEFVNRIDRVLPFNPLTPDLVRAMAVKELEALVNREGLEVPGLLLSWDEAVPDMLAEIGYDPKYGARPLQRSIEQLVVVPLARYLVAHPKLAEQVLHLSLDERGRILIQPTP